MGKINVAIIGVGNCASSLVQGVLKYGDASNEANIPGIMHSTIGDYAIGDIEFVAAFDIDSNKVVISELSKNKTVCIVTIKSVSCPVCTEQLIRIRDRMKEFNRCNLTFLVLAPGGKDGIKELRKRTKFPFPFVQDKNLEIAKRFDLAVPPFEIMPAVILLEKDGSVRWSKPGRGPDYYSDQALSDYLDCVNWI